MSHAALVLVLGSVDSHCATYVRNGEWALSAPAFSCKALASPPSIRRRMEGLQHVATACAQRDVTQFHWWSNRFYEMLDDIGNLLFRSTLEWASSSNVVLFPPLACHGQRGSKPVG